MRQLTMLSLFSGIGGIDLAAEWAGIKTVAFCEIDQFCQKVLKKHWPDVPIYSDIRALRGDEFGTVDIIAGGFPCQPFSVAGKQRGKEDDRYLWEEMSRIIKAIRPTWVIGENVTGLIKLALDDVSLDLESEGYTTQTFIIPACGVGAPHRRERVFIVANSCSYASNTRGPKSEGQQWASWVANGIDDVADTESQQDRGICQSRPQPNPRTISNEYSQGYRLHRDNWWTIEPNVDRVANGIPDRVDRLKSLGNAVVPQQIYPIFKAIVDIEKDGY